MAASHSPSKSLRAELGPNPDLRQSVAELDVIARLSTLRAIAAFRLHQRIGFGTALTHHSPQRRDRRVIGGVEGFRPIFLSDPDPATLVALLRVPAQRAYSAERDVADGRAFLERGRNTDISFASSSRPGTVPTEPIRA